MSVYEIIGGCLAIATCVSIIRIAIDIEKIRELLEKNTR